MILSCAEMKALEQRAFSDGVQAEDLMEQAGKGIASFVSQSFPKPGVCLAVFGRGNNGGDALVAARELNAAGWQVHLIPASHEERWGELVRKKAAQANGCLRGDLSALHSMRGRPLVILDGLLGIGATGALRDSLPEFTRAINARRQNHGAHVFALDIPTGLNGDTGAPGRDCVIADTTVAIGFAKTALLADPATSYVGRLRRVPLSELSARLGDRDMASTIVTPAALTSLLPRRRHDSHKGDYGRIGIVAGAPGMLGAGVLCAKACVRAGAGLTTLYALPPFAAQLATMTPPEVMVRTVSTYREAWEQRHDVFAVGPGLGLEQADVIQEAVRRVAQPMVLDADGLNAIASSPGALDTVAGERLLTPHPGEMGRLAPDLVNLTRADLARNFVARQPRTTLLLKGARTIVAQRDRPLAYNTTGGPAMAKGGMGDVLTGVLAALVGQGLSPYDAAQLGAWLCGRAAEFAVDSAAETEQTLTPSRLLDFLPLAFTDIYSGW